MAPAITRQLADDFARATRAACYGRVGLCTQRYGTLAAWLVQALNLVTGHLDEVGGMMLTTPAVDAVAILSRLGLRGTYDRWRSRVRGVPEVCASARHRPALVGWICGPFTPQCRQFSIFTRSVVASARGPVRQSAAAITGQRRFIPKKYRTRRFARMHQKRRKVRSRK